MTEKDVKIYICDFCGRMSEDKEFLRLHEECCPKNPKNQPCSTCSNQLLGMGCMRGMNMEDVGGNVLCFHYRRGTPQNPMSILLEGNHLEDDKND